MGEQVEEFKFSHKEVVEALIKQQGIHHGIWMLSLQFGIGGANIQNPDNPLEINPAAIIPVVSIGLQKKTELNPLAVDASVVNPPLKPTKKRV
jgi:hypothetical protein